MVITAKPAGLQYIGPVSSVKNAPKHTQAKTTIWILQLLLE
jgi:hypothetical protein